MKLLHLLIIPFVMFTFLSCDKSKDNPITSTEPTSDWEGDISKYNEPYRDSVLFNSTRYDGTNFVPSVNIMYKDGSGIHAIVNDWYTFAACWSPRKWKILFLRDSSSGRAEPGLYVMNADGSAKKRLSPVSDRIWGISCSPDGKKIACVILNDQGQGKLRIADPDYTNLQDITGFFGGSEFHTLSWSNDSRRLVFDGANGGIGVIDANGANNGLLFSYSQQCWEPSWSHGGDRVAFASFTHPDTNYYTEIFVYNIGNKSILQLTNMKQTMTTGPSWSWDDQKIIFSSRGPGSSPDHLFMMNADGSNVQQITYGNDSDWRPSW